MMNIATQAAKAIEHAEKVEKQCAARDQRIAELEAENQALRSVMNEAATECIMKFPEPDPHVARLMADNKRLREALEQFHEYIPLALTDAERFSLQKLVAKALAATKEGE